MVDTIFQTSSEHQDVEKGIQKIILTLGHQSEQHSEEIKEVFRNMYPMVQEMGKSWHYWRLNDTTIAFLNKLKKEILWELAA